MWTPFLLAGLPFAIAAPVQKRTTASQWTSLGCVADASPRVLSDKVYSGMLNSADHCVDLCASKGYTFAGVQYSWECWCGNARNGGPIVSASQCSATCPGDTAQNCGAAYRMNLYQAPVANGELVGCYRDPTDRVLAYEAISSSSMTPSVCVSHCSSKGYAMAGLKNGNQCFCGDNYGTASGVDGCKTKCSGDASKTCGGPGELDIWRTGSSSSHNSQQSGNQGNNSQGNNSQGNNSQGNGNGNSQGGQSNGNDDQNGSQNNGSGNQSGSQNNGNSSQSGGQSSGTDSQNNGQNNVVISSNAATQVNTNQPSVAGSGQKFLWAHHMIGNTYTYKLNNWSNDIRGAMQAGFDGFVLNLGRETWEAQSVAYAYEAAQGTGFKLFQSFDMTSLPCGSPADADQLAAQAAKYANHAAQALYQNKVLVTTFSGENCRFGQSSVQAGWNYFRSRLQSRGVAIYFMPAHFAGTDTFGGADWFDGVMDWNGQWPLTDRNPTLDRDMQYISALGSNRGYMAGISPFFFTYYGPRTWNKNWIYRSDDWLLATRWEQLLRVRNRFDHLQFVSWNDFGESHYIAQPGDPADQPNSEGWTDGMPHTGLWSLIRYYAQAWKTGSFPEPTDSIWVWSRPHPKDATPSHPTNPRPNYADWTDDGTYAMVLLSDPAEVILQSGGNTAKFRLQKGMNKVAVASAEGAIKVQIVRDGTTVKSLDTSGQFSYTNTPRDYNFNYYVQNA